jgi:hypothetical protein
MAITFDRGDPGRPRGHALAYFRAPLDPEKLYATYIIVLPISVDIGKYVPPFLASQLGNVSLSDFSAFAMPPVPEEGNSHRELVSLAEIRDDDLLDGGTIRSSGLPEMMQTVTDLVREYAQAWADSPKPAVPLDSGDGDDSAGVNEVLYGLMNEQDRLAELSKIVGRLRFAVEGHDTDTQDDMGYEVRALSRHLPEGYHIPALLQALMDSSVRGGELAQLYLDRCYKLSNGDYAGARDLDRRIESLKPSP